MLQIHPALSGAPTSFILAALALELALLIRERVVLRHAMNVVVALAMIATIATYLSGYFTEEHVHQTFRVPLEAIEAHHGFATWLLISVIAWGIIYFVAQIATQGRAFWRGVSLVAVLVSALLALGTGYRGGELVFRHGAGVAAPLSATQHRKP